MSMAIPASVADARRSFTPSIMDGQSASNFGAGTAKYKGVIVHVSPLPYKIDLAKPSREFILLMQEMKHLTHPNVNRFIGFCNREDQHGGKLIVHAHCRRGGLNRLLNSGFLDWDLKFSLGKELAEAIYAIRRTALRFHGNITFKKCLVDEYFGLKLTDLVAEKLKGMRPAAVKSLNFDDDEDMCRAPEIIRGDTADTTSDVYSFGVIAAQLLDISIFAVPDGPTVTEEGQLRFAFQDEWERLLAQCVSGLPSDRPLAKTLVQAFEKSSKSEGRTGSLFDVIMARLQTYSARLEDLVRDRTQDLIMEREKCDGILREILPREVVRILRQGGLVQPEMFDKVSLMFLAIANFTPFVSRVPPFVIVHFLHELYSNFDVTVAKFKVYKVETIGDQYLVVSGMPETLGDEHANEICRLALELQRTYENMASVDESLNVQVGVHSGSVAAGVVGFRQPRYCLFGDAVNTASRMLSTGEPTKIQLSFATAPLLTSDEFRVEERGTIMVKGKGMVNTYFLYSKHQPETLEVQNTVGTNISGDAV